MGEDCGSWHPRMNFNWESSYPNSLSAPPDWGQCSYMNPGTNMVSTNGSVPFYGSSEIPNLRGGQDNEPAGWYYCLPRFQQAVIPTPTSVLKEKLPAPQNVSCREAMKPNLESGFAQKSFLVVDKSGDQTTLIFSPGIGNSVRCVSSWNPNTGGAYNSSGEDAGTKRSIENLSEPILTDESNDNNETGVESEMHEDTEELNALLYSDDDSDYTEDDDDEVTSTGHSPSTMTAYDNQNLFEGSTEEVASSAGTTKKRKLCDGGYNAMPVPLDSPSLAKPNRSSELEDDAESSCANDQNFGLMREMNSFASNKKMRKEKICEIVSILQSIIPVGKGKEAMVVLDEAIQYLMKVKANAFGFDSL
ncbi:hypothetical protein UlMin_034751 [Ulmus minor]